MGWIETALNWLQEHWQVFLGILTSQTFLLIVLSLLKTKRVITNAKVQLQQHRDKEALNKTLEQSEARLGEKFDGLASELQAFIYAALNVPWNKEQREMFEERKAETQRKHATNAAPQDAERAETIPPKKTKKKIRLISGGAA